VCPAFIRFNDIGFPMMPSPINPTFRSILIPPDVH
jgi:hypothetical protein